MEKKAKVSIIDYQLGNLFSVKQACEFLGYDAVITTDKKELLDSDFAILPGVGAFADAMQNLQQFDLIEPIKDFIAGGKPFMGVCLGLQLLFTESEEFGNSKGLNIVEGIVKKFPAVNNNGSILKVPQIEWNQIFMTINQKWVNSPLKSCKNEDFMYFVHSFYTEPSISNFILSTTTYGDTQYCSSIKKDNIFACQFHPEKSSQHGLSIYKNWFEQTLK